MMNIFRVLRHHAPLFALAASVVPMTSFAATFSLGGDARFGTNMYNNLDLAPGVVDGAGNTASYLEYRLRVAPNVVVDDRFSINSNFSLMQAGPNGSNDVPGSFGIAPDRTANYENQAAVLKLHAAYLQWASDWGIFRFGRQPKNWGLGIVHNPGNGVLADFSSSVDRAGFQALLGNLGLNLGFEKAKEGKLNWDGDDAESYEIGIDYSNAESLFDVGILYTRNIRSASSGLGLSSSHDLSIFTRKRWGQVQLGTELATSGQDTKSNVVGWLAQVDYMPGAWKISTDVAVATASSDAAFNFHPNYQPFMILFRQSVGATDSGEVRGGSSGNAVGSAVGAGDGSGAILAKVGIGYGFSKDRYILGFDVGGAQLLRQGSNSGKSLGFETDLTLAQKWYDNFTMHYGFGLLFPGSGFGDGAQVAWGTQIRGALKF